MQTGNKRVVIIAMVKNECDIIEQWVRHNIQFCDAMLIFEDGSTDGTVDILNALYEEGMPLYFFQDDQKLGYQRAGIIGSLTAGAIEGFEADTVIELNADEFIMPFHPVRVKELIGWTDPRVPTYHMRTDYIVSSQTITGFEENILDHMKICFPRGLNEIADNYRVFVSRQRYLLDNSNSQIQLFPNYNVSLAHFPFRGPIQSKKKIIYRLLGLLSDIEVWNTDFDSRIKWAYSQLLNGNSWKDIGLRLYACDKSGGGKKPLFNLIYENEKFQKPIVKYRRFRLVPSKNDIDYEIQNTLVKIDRKKKDLLVEMAQIRDNKTKDDIKTKIHTYSEMAAIISSQRQFMTGLFK